MSSVEQYYKILELEPGATLEEVNQGYKDLALVWHPDRFPSHPRLQQKAQEKFQQINEAHEMLRSCLRIAVSVSSSRNPESRKTAAPESPANGKDYYKYAENWGGSQFDREYNYDRRPFTNFKSKPKDVQGWLD